MKEYKLMKENNKFYMHDFPLQSKFTTKVFVSSFSLKLDIEI